MSSLYLALGDSITTGYGVGANQSFAALYYAQLRHMFPGIQYMNLGVNGLTSHGLLTVVRSAKISPFLARSGIITLTIGSNDLLAVGKAIITGAGANINLTLGNLNHNLLSIGYQIREVNPSALVKIATIYNPLPPMNKQNTELAQGLVKSANHSISQMAREYHFKVIPVAKALSGRERILLGPDHLHPNPLGHQVVAELFIKY